MAALIARPRLPSFPCLLLLLLVSSPAFADSTNVSAPALATGGDTPWTPHLEEQDGEVKDLGDPRHLSDKDWLAIRYGEYSGFKTRLGVVLSEAENLCSPKYKKTFAKLIMDLSGKPERLAQPQNHMEDLVRQALASTHRFNLLERTTALEDIAREQGPRDTTGAESSPASPEGSGEGAASRHAPADSNRADSSAIVSREGANDAQAAGGPAVVSGNRIDPAAAPRSGEIRGAEYLVKATLIEINPEKDTKEIKTAAGAKSGSSVGGLDVGIKNKIAFCRLNFRVIRVESGDIVVDQTLDGTASSTGLTGAGGFGLRMLGRVAGKSKKAPPIANAMHVCANKAAYYAATLLQESTWQGTVASVTGRQMTINGGTNVGLQEGMTLTLLGKGADIVDPETNAMIGFETSEIGQIRIVSTQEKFSTCEIIQGGDGAKQGDLVRRENHKR